jgi:mannose-6-phosphate isomerase-like protein (cupin superfamily)
MTFMRTIDHHEQLTEEWRAGVMTRMRVSALTEAVQLCIFEQWCAPGTGAPTHLHAVEEVLTVLEGEAEIWMGDERGPVAAGQSVVVPAGCRHGFRNIGATQLHLQATLAAPFFEAWVDDKKASTRHWLRSPDQASVC